MQLPVSSYLSLPENPGVYLFLNNKGKVLYVGKAKNLKERVSSYFAKWSTLARKTQILVSKVENIRVIGVASEIESLLLEANFIKKYYPPYNTRLTDGKRYPLIKITIRDPIPKVLIARRIEDKEPVGLSLYFGPYPNVGALRLVLKTMRRVFPFQSVINHPKRPCLYYHLHLCPCPTVFPSGEYRKDIRRIIKFLKGDMTSVINDLKKERDTASKNEDFEKAKMLQKKIDSMILITKPVHRPFEYETNPNLLSDLRKEEMELLRNTLLRAGTKTGELVRIECFDISNTSGKFATGSMVVFTSGEKDTSEYKRFRIKKGEGMPNDFAMMEEVIERRMKHTDWPLPNLLIVDGGKGQISSALKVLQKTRVSIPVIGLAKREEIIITSDFKEIRLQKNSKALHLVMRIRDEAHRFALTYHRSLRSKMFI